MAVILVFFALFLIVKIPQPSECQNISHAFFRKIQQEHLGNHVIDTKQLTNNELECALHCVDDGSCESVNYKTSGIGKGLCELNNSTLPKTSNANERIRNPEFDHLYIVGKRHKSSCVNIKVPGDFDLSFESVQKFTLLDNNVPEMSDMTLMFWINTLNADKMTVLSYAVGGTEEFAFSVEREKMYLKVQQLEKYFFVPPINDGYWHHVGASMSRLGNYTIFLDGTLVYSGDELGSNLPLKSGGAFVVGQKLGSSDGNSESSFSGKLSQLNVWSRFMSADAAEMKLKNQSCFNKEALGNVFTWSSLKDNCNSMVVMEQPSSCKPLRKNPRYDIVIKPSQNKRSVHNITYDEELDGFTITAWVKYEKNASLKLNAELQKFVDYKNASGTSLLSFYLTAESLTLEINGAEKREARIPWFWNESPAYWHHIATTWSSDTGHWKIYLDGSLVSIMHDVATNITIPAGRKRYLQLNGYEDSSQSRLNIWNYEIDGHALSLMANKGPLFENGNVFAWYGIKSKVEDDNSIEFQETPYDIHNSRTESEFQMTFLEASDKNYVKIENVFTYQISVFSLCFWAKFPATNEVSGIFAYSTNNDPDEILVYYHKTKSDLVFLLNYKDLTNAVVNKREKVLTPDSWHFYCLQWRNSDGLHEIYQDGEKLGTSDNGTNGHIIPANGTVVLGQEMDSHGGGFQGQQAFKGSLAGLNLWRQFLTVNVIQGMASGVINVNGNLLQWRNIRTKHLFGSVTIRNGSEAEIPEYRVQHLRDEWCEKKFNETVIYARFIRGQGTNGYKWRCVQPAAMLDENMCYNITKNSSLYQTEAKEENLLGIN